MSTWTLVRVRSMINVTRVQSVHNEGHDRKKTKKVEIAAWH